MLLTSCVGFQHVAFNESGTIKSITQVDATLAEGENSAREVVGPGGVAVRSIQQRYDATRVGGGVLDMLTTTGVAKLMQPSVIKGTKDPNIIPADPNKIPKNPNVIPLDPNKVIEAPLGQ